MLILTPECRLLLSYLILDNKLQGIEGGYGQVDEGIMA